MQRFLHTLAGRAVAQFLIAWLVLHPLWELSQPIPWAPVALGPLVDRVTALVLPGPAHAATPTADPGQAREVTKTQPLGSLVGLDATRSQDPDGDPLTYQWFGPFAPASGPTPTVPIPEGQYTLSLHVDDGTARSAIATTTVTVTPCFALTPRAKPGKIQLTWTPRSGTVRYDIYRATATDPFHFAKIAQTPATQAAYLDTVPSDTTYLYLVGAVAQSGSCYSAVTSAVAPSSRTLATYAPVIYSAPVTQGTVDILYTYDVNVTDPGGHSLSYRLVTSPAGMAIDAVTGLFRWLPPQAGAFDVTVEVRNSKGRTDRQSFRLAVTVLNTPPVAHAGADQTVLVGEVATLDGSRSTDLDGDPLTYHWSLAQRPTGSAAMLDDAAAVRPRFQVDTPGTYRGQLVVNDGQVDSVPDTVTVTTSNSKPVANAGPDQTVFVTQTVPLDGSRSSDVDGDALTFHWTLVERPHGSQATLSEAEAVHPTFVADVPGTYVAQLVVHDGQLDSAPDTVTITTRNSPPVAHAGPRQTVVVGATVTLDGSRSSDVDGDMLIFRWALLTQPSGSSALLSDPGAVKPTFEVDAPGTYVAQLIVNDGQVDSAPDTVMISTVNSPPVANAGPDQTVLVTQTVQLDGSKSSDVDGDRLTYRWAFTAIPPDSQAILSASTIPHPTFEVDVPGTYVVQLIVHDSQVDSAPDTVTILTANSPPVASAGPDQSVFADQIVQLDGSQSRDVDRDVLHYRWSFTSIPAGSTAVLVDALSVNPTFQVDRPGLYVVQLVVDDGQVDSVPDTVVISTENSRPVAHAGPDQQGVAGDTVLLDGSGSADADGDRLAYRWAFLTLPAGSSASLDTTAPRPSFVADLAGTYVLQLIVNDSHEDSHPDTVTVTAVQPNRPPRITSTPVTTATVGQPYLYDVEATDLDAGDTLTFALTAAPAGMTIDERAGLVQWTPLAAQVGEHSVTVQVQDQDGLTAMQSFTITVPQPNRPPRITSVPLTTAAVDVMYSYDVEATDPDVGDVLTFALTTAPAGMSIDAATGLVQWTPTAAQVGTHDVTVRVQDAGGLFAMQAFRVAVPQPNHPPAITSTPVTDATAGQLYNYDVDATDPDVGDTLTFALTTAPAGMAIAPATGLLQWTPTVEQAPGPYMVSILISDQSGSEATQSFTIVVRVNRKPTAIGQSVGVLRAIPFLPPFWTPKTAAFTLQGDDLDGDALSYALVDMPQYGALKGTPPALTYVPNPCYTGPDRLTFRVSDGQLASEVATVTIYVSDDCNRNGIADLLDIANGTSQDCNGNGIPDECDVAIKGRGFTALASWTAYNPGDYGVGADPDGYAGGAFDGRYIYFAPHHNGSTWFGEILRYDTQAAFGTPEAWKTYDLSTNVHAQLRGFSGAVFDGRYVSSPA